MAVFELLFLVVLLTSAVSVVSALVMLFGSRARQAGKLLLVTAIGLAAYLLTVAGVGLLSTQRSLAPGEAQCFDDWCVAVVGVAETAELGLAGQSVQADGSFYLVTVELSNQARGRDQRASSAAVHLLDSNGRSYAVSPEGQQAFEAQSNVSPPLTTTLEIGEHLDTVQVFEIPADAVVVGLTVEHPVGFSPGWFVISGPASLLHPPTVLRLP